MRRIRPVLVLASALMLAACATTAPREASVAAESVLAPAHDNLNATVWMQNSAEYQAAVRGVYAAAERSLDAALADPSWNALPQGEAASGFESKPPAIIVDADETFIDNSAYQARGVIEDRGYSRESWLEWVKAEKAAALPGAVDFARHVADRGVTIFYVTNRDAPDEVAATTANLRALGFPVAEDGSNVILRGDVRAPDRDKGQRRRWVDRNYRVLLLLGDNLGDFIDGTSADIATREAMMAPYQAWWGVRWFMLPNPSYGSWYNAILRSCAKDEAPRACVRASLRHDY